MAAIKHLFVNPKTDSADTTITRPVDWNADHDLPVTTKGDLMVATGADAVNRVGVGTNGKVLTADSSQTEGVIWNATLKDSGSVERLRWDTTGVSIDAGLSYLNTYGDQVGRHTWDWNGRVAVENTVTATGTVTTGTATLAYTVLDTGVTSGSTAGMRAVSSVSVLAQGVNKLRLLKLAIQYGSIDANTVSNIYLTDESVTGAPSATARHIGLRQAGTVINFSTADGTTEQTTNVSAFITAQIMVDVLFDGTTALCYLNGVLRATHATNVPTASAVQPVLRAYLTNSAAAAKQFYVGTVRAVFSA